MVTCQFMWPETRVVSPAILSHVSDENILLSIMTQGLRSKVHTCLKL